jgi:transposase-like protein
VTKQTKKEQLMTRQEEYSLMEEILQLVSGEETDKFAQALSLILNEAMKIERSEALGAEPYERNENRRGYANGFKDKSYLTQLGKLVLKIPQVRGGLEFYPAALEKGIRSERALKLAIAEMYIKGVSTRKVSDIVEKLCGTEISSSQVSRLSAELDEEVKAWQSRPLGAFPYLYLDATYENVRIGKSVQKAALLVAIGVNEEGKRHVLGVSVSLSEAEVHWRTFLQSLCTRGLHGVKLITSDDHYGLKAARESCFSGVPWQRCQFHLQQNARAYVPKKSMQQEVTQTLRTIFNAPDRMEAERYLETAIDRYAERAPELAEWMESNIPEGLTVFDYPIQHRRKLRTTNMVERQMREVKRRTRVVSIFPNTESAERLVVAYFMETTEQWQSEKIYLTIEPDRPASRKNYRKRVA